MSRRTLGAGALAITSLLVAAPVAGQDMPTEILVRESGAEPLTELRYDWSAGLMGTTVVAADTAVVSMVNGVVVAEEQSSAERVVTRTVTEVADDGTARIEFSVESPEREGQDIPAAEAVPGEVEDALRAEVAALGDYSGWMLLDDRGVLLDYGVDGLSDATAAFLVQTRGLGGELTVLPEEPVGVGASWETYTEVFESSLTFEAETLTTLAAIDGSTLSLEQETEVSQEPNLGLERLAISAGAIYASQELEGSAVTELSLDGLGQTGTGEVTLSIITGAAAGTGGTELQTIYEMALTASTEG